MTIKSMKRDSRKPFTLDEIEATMSPAQRTRVTALVAKLAAEERNFALVRKAPVKKTTKRKAEKAPRDAD